MKFKNHQHFLAVPYALFLVLFVILPIFIIIYYAFTDASGNFTWQALISFFTSTTKLSVLFVSLLIGLFNTIFCLLIGYPIAYLLANPKYNKNAMMVMLFVLPMWVNFVLRTGATRDILSWIGIDSGAHPIIATMIGMVYNYLPFTILPLYSTMLRLDHGQVEAAADLGCSPSQVFFKNIIPQTLPGIAAGAQMVFMPTMSSYVISDTMSNGKIMLFGNSIALSFNNSDWNSGSFMALIMLILVFASMLLTKKFSRKNGYVRGGGSW